MARDLVKLTKKSRAIIQLQVQKGRQLVRHIPEPVQLGLSKLSKSSLVLTLEIFAGLFVVGSVVLALAYGRLNQGPMSLSSLVPIMEEAINRELAGIEVKIDDAILQRDPFGPGVHFRLTNIRLIDKQGAVVAQAPLAGIGLSGRALLRGRIALGSVDFIGPRLLLFYSKDGLSSTFSPGDGAENRQEAGGKTVAPGQSANPQQQPNKLRPGLPIIEPAKGVDAKDISLSRTITAAFDQARKHKTASSFLTRFGVRDAVVIFDQLGTQSFWQVPDFSIDLDHKKKRSIILGQGEISSANGPWKFNFRTEQSTKQQSLTFFALVEDLIPRGLAANLPAFPFLQALNLPLTAKTSVRLSTAGELLGAEVDVKLAAGFIEAPWDHKRPMHIKKGDIRIRYDARKERIDILPSRLEWGQSHATISGAFRKTTGPGGKKIWAFELNAADSALGVEDFGLPPTKVHRWEAKGTVDPDSGTLVVEHFVIQLPTGSIVLAGTVVDAPGSPAVNLAGRFSAMPLNTLKQLWPKFIGSGAREWIGERVSAGHLGGGTFQIDFKAGEFAALKKGGDIPDSAFNLKMTGTGLAIHYIKKMPPIQTSDITISMTGRSMVMDVSDGWIDLPSGKKIMLGSGRFSVDDLRPKIEIGRVEFQAAGSAQAVLELLDQPPFGYAREVGVKPSALGGKVDGKFTIDMPLIKDLEFQHVRLNGAANLVEATANGVFGGASVEGGEVTFNLTEKALEARGDILVNGVPAVMSWQRIFDAPPEKQPELRLSAVLDDASRSKLGIALNHMLRGPVPVIVSIDQIPVEGKPQRIRVQADLGGAELILANVGWRKPPGRAAVLSFDIGKGVEGNTELQNFRIIGDDIAIDGWVSLGENHWPNAFFFPDFSFNVITHLEVTGKLNQDKIWEVEANGPAYDGRQFFKSLFSSGRLTDDQPPGPKDALGVKLTARIGAMVGHFDTTVKNVSISLEKHQGRLTKLDVRGKLDGESNIAVRLIEGGVGERVVLAESDDAGAAFRLIGFYPSMEGGQASLKVTLDDQGEGKKAGTLWAKDFVILGDRVITEVISNAGEDPGVSFGTQQDGKPRRRRQRIPFNQLEVPFAVGDGQFVLYNSYINGPQLGATIRGTVDIKNNIVDLGGTYVPLDGLNAAGGSSPIVGQLRVGRRGEGVVGITYAIKGPAGNPRVLVNPLSIVTPGIFRQIFEFTGRTQGAFPRDPQSGAPKSPGSPFDPERFGGAAS